MKKLICAVFIMLLMCSCGNEPNDIAYVVALGFDEGQNENYKVTIQFASPNEISGGSSEESEIGEKIIENLTVEAPDMYSAVNIANSIVSKSFSLSHAKIVVFSEELAKNGLEKLVSTMIRSEELRPDVFVAISKNSAEEYLNSVDPIIEINPAKYYQLIYDDSYAYGIPKTNLQDFYFNQKLKEKNSLIPLANSIAGKNNDENTQNEENNKAEFNETPFEYKVRNYKAGQAMVNGSITSEAMGMEIFDGGTALDSMGSVECEIYNLLSGKIKGEYVSFKNPKNNEIITIKINGVKKPRYKIDIEKKKIEIILKIESDLYSICDSFDMNTESDHLEEKLKEFIQDDCENFIVNMRDKYNADVLGLGAIIKKQFWTNESFHEYDFKNDFKNYDIDVFVNFKIRRTGMKY